MSCLENTRISGSPITRDISFAQFPRVMHDSSITADADFESETLGGLGTFVSVRSSSQNRGVIPFGYPPAAHTGGDKQIRDPYSFESRPASLHPGDYAPTRRATLLHHYGCNRVRPDSCPTGHERRLSFQRLITTSRRIRAIGVPGPRTAFRFLSVTGVVSFSGVDVDCDADARGQVSVITEQRASRTRIRGHELVKSLPHRTPSKSSSTNVSPTALRN